jgi:hypothetical protein
MLFKTDPTERTVDSVTENMVNNGRITDLENIVIFNPKKVFSFLMFDKKNFLF